MESTEDTYMKHISTILMVLSLCLSLAMPSFAALSEPEQSIHDATAFPDAARIVHWEAVASLTKYGIITGWDDGLFHPEAPLTRAQAAILFTHILNMWEPNDETFPTFPDTRGHWAEPYISFCASLQIASGRGNGTFDPDAPITGLELLKMALVALGYGPDDHIYRLLGESWAEEADRLARSTRPSLYNGLDGVIITQPITRDNAAQILYNTINADSLSAVGTRHYPDGTYGYEYAYAKRKDGAPASMLYIFFGLDGMGPIPPQPELDK